MNELQHHGIKGQRWGIRRYQNPDGSLTDAGKKRLHSKSPDKISKDFRKQVRTERANQSNWYNKWDTFNTIGPNSKSERDRYSKDVKAYRNSEKYKNAVKKQNNLDRKVNNGNIIDFEEYDEKSKAIWKDVQDSSLSATVTFTKNGRKYVNEYLNKYGKSENVAYLKDLGFNDEAANEINSIIIKSKRKLLSGL